MHILFANTGVQIVCVPLPLAGRPSAASVGRGWQPYEAQGPDGRRARLPYLQWRFAPGSVGKLFLAVDTTCGRPEDGYACDLSALDRDLPIPLDLAGLVGPAGKPMGLAGRVELVLRPLGAGDPKAVDLVVDLGNSRTGALLLEPTGDRLANPPLPFVLVNRHRLDAWDERGEFDRARAERWFSSRTHWCTAPYRPPGRVSRVRYKSVRGWFGTDARKWEESVTPDLFRDLSMARMGREAEDVTLAIRAGGDLRTGVSSPKRYLWADDAGWLEGADWFMADPDDRSATGAHAARLHGPLLRFLPEDDRDDLLAGAPADAPEAPPRPRHAPRTLMVAALYELLCQAYTAINSTAYRVAAGDPARPRQLRSLTLTYPSGMVSEERARLELQAKKAARIFRETLGRGAGDEPHVTLEIDEASATHITYIWSELQMTGLDPALWFSLVGARDEVRIACIDIGGGTTDFMVARYTFARGVPDSIVGEVLERDGVAVAGDHLVKNLLETVVVPAFASAVGLGRDAAKLLFGPETPHNLSLRAERINWLNRMLVPLARRYLDHAADDDRRAEISHTDASIVPPEVLDSLEAGLRRLRRDGDRGGPSLRQPLGLTYDPAELDRAVLDVFRDVLLDFGRRIVDHGCDIVLLAGQPTKLATIQRLVHLILPLAPSRIIPLHRHYAGSWYPFQDRQGREPGAIVDPKSAVVVGAAIHFLAKYGMLGTVKFAMNDATRRRSYHWGVINEATSGIVFPLSRPGDSRHVHEFVASQRHVQIGRSLHADPSARASPVYLLRIDSEGQLGDIDVRVRLRRVPPATESDEETLELDAASGTVAGREAIRGENVTLRLRTLPHDKFYLDAGALDNLWPDA